MMVIVSGMEDDRSIASTENIGSNVAHENKGRNLLLRSL